MSYWNKQLEELGCDAFKDFPEREKVFLSDRTENPTLYRLYYQHPLSMKPSERQSVSKTLGDGYLGGGLDKRIMIIAGCGMGPMVQLPDPIDEKGTPTIYGVVDNRLEFALRHCALPTLENFEDALDGAGWTQRVDRRSEYMKRVHDRLNSYTFVTARPF